MKEPNPFAKLVDYLKYEIANSKPSVPANLLTGQKWNANIPGLGGLISPVPGYQRKYPEDVVTVYAKNRQEEATPTPTPYQHKIPINHPNMKEIPQQINYQDRSGKQQSYNLAQGLMENFDDIKEATRAGQMLAHEYSQTYSPQEIADKGHESWNFGENPNFKVIADSLQKNGTWDKGLMRNNTGTFDDLMSFVYWKDRMEEAGLNKHSDLDDPEKALKMSRLILENSNWDSEEGKIRLDPRPRWQRWFAAPLENRFPNPI